jgi:transposase-like protein
MQDIPPPTAPVPPCPHCRCVHVVRNGHNRAGTANFLCRGCQRQFVERPQRGPVPEATRELVRRLLLERVALRAIARITGRSRSWLQRFANELYRQQTPWEPGLPSEPEPEPVEKKDPPN